MNKICFALAAAWLSVAAAADRPAIPATLTLPEALDIAFRSSTALTRAAALVTQSEGLAGQARSPLLPQIGLSAAETGQTVNLRTFGISFPGAPAKVGPFQTVDARANLTQNLLNLPARDRSRASLEQVKATRALAMSAHEMLAYQVAVAYSQTFRAQNAAATLERQLALARKLHATTQDRVELGVSTQLDAKRSQQQVNSIEQALIEAENTVTSAKLQLANLLHAEVTANYTVAEPPAVAASDGALATALEARPDYRAALTQIRAAELRLSAVKAQRYPVVQIRANYGQSGPAINQNLNTFQVQGAISVPIYTGGRIEGETVEAQGKIAELKAQADELRSQIETEVLSNVANVDSGVRQLAVARRNVTLANEELDLSNARFTGGVADNTEVVNAQDRITRAEDAVIRAAFQLDIARAQLARALGTAEKTYRGAK